MEEKLGIHTRSPLADQVLAWSEESTMVLEVAQWDELMVQAVEWLRSDRRHSVGCLLE